MAHLLNLFKKVPTSTWLPFLCQNFMALNFEFSAAGRLVNFFMYTLLMYKKIWARIFPIPNKEEKSTLVKIVNYIIQTCHKMAGQCLVPSATRWWNPLSDVSAVTGRLKSAFQLHTMSTSTSKNINQQTGGWPLWFPWLHELRLNFQFHYHIILNLISNPAEKVHAGLHTWGNTREECVQYIKPCLFWYTVKPTLSTHPRGNSR